MTIRLKARRLEHAHDLAAPVSATAGSAGLDLVAAIDSPVVLRPGERRLVPTGWALEIPAGWEGQVRPRSGLALDHGVTVANSPGTIDSDYRGEVAVILINLGERAHTVERGDRIAQLVLAPVAVVEVEEVPALGATTRAAGGFGSTGR